MSTEKKKVIKRRYIIATFACLSIYYNYKRHVYEQELFKRFNYVLENNVKLSGVYIQQRQAFQWLWYLQWLLPYHQSLKIKNKSNNTTRHVGLGSTGNFLQSGFVDHTDIKYKYLNRFNQSIPIECWVDYKRTFGHYPENIDIELLNEITITNKEAEVKGKSIDKVFNTRFLCLIKGIHDRYTISTCQYAVMYAIRKEELERLSKNNKN